MYYTILVKWLNVKALISLFKAKTKSDRSEIVRHNNINIAKRKN